MSGGMPGFPAGTVTHRGIVNTPECDENGHMNVQFYWARFARADQQFWLMAGIDAADVPVRLSRHVRYHAELHGAVGLAIVSRLATDAEGAIGLLHQMVDGDSGALSATAFDRLALAPHDEARIRAHWGIEPAPPAALPRSLAGRDPDPALPEAEWRAAGAVETCRCEVEPQLVDPDGTITDRGLVALSVEAAPATWLYAGFGQARLQAQGLGRVALEKRLLIARRPRVGDPIHILSRLIAAERVAFSVRHRYVDSRTGAFLASCDVTLLAMDLTRRKGVPLPDDVKAHMQALLGR